MTPTGTMKSTLTSIDSLDGGEGKDTLNVKSDEDILAVTATIKNIETINLESGKDIGKNTADFDTTTFTGAETLNVKKATNAYLKAAATTDVNVSGVTGDIEVTNGKNVVVNDNTVDTDIIVNGAAGTITVTDTKNAEPAGTNNIKIDGGTDVTVTATADASSGDIEIGTAKQATGDVKVTQNLNSDGTAAVTGGTIGVTGGKTVDVTVNSTITAKDASAISNITNGGVTVNSDGKTTDVTVKQNSTVTEFVTPETALVNGKTAITFKAMTAGQALSIDGLSFHATKNLTASEVAAAFANLTALDTQANGGTTANGYYTGALTTAGLTTGAANGAVVEFISVNQTPVAFTANSYANIGAGKMVGYLTSDNSEVNAIEPDAPTTTAGTAFSAESDTNNSVTYGDVTVNEKAAVAASITTVTLDGFKDAVLGTTNALNALTTLSIANSAGITTLKTTKTALTLNVDNITSAVDLDGSAAAITTLTINANGEASDFKLTAAKVETLTVAAAADLDLDNASVLSALKTVTITGAGDVTLGDISSKLETLTASAATGDISATVDGDLATVTTGSGDDSIVVKSATEVTKAITLGAGDDRLDLSTITTVNATTTAAIAGGAGSDTVVLNADNAIVTALSSVANSAIFKDKVTGFEKLEIAGATTIARDVNVGNLGYNHVILGANTTALTLSDMANNGTVVLNAAQTAGATVAVKDAAAGLTDVLNVVVNTEDTLTTGALTVNNVETINISTVDLDADELSDGAVTLDLNADSAKTVTITGNAHLDLDMTGNTAATLIDASTMTGNLTVTAYNAGMTVKGGAGNDTLSVFGAKSGVVLTGGAGTDKFDVSQFDSLGNAGSAVTITDLTAGETIQFADAALFVSSKITLISEATFTEYVAEAAKVAKDAGTGNNISWFQFNNNTFAVQDMDTSGTFNTGDIIVKINGVKDLSTASFNATTDTLEIA